MTFDGTGHAHFRPSFKLVCHPAIMVMARNRYVRTPGFVEELEAEKMYGPPARQPLPMEKREGLGFDVGLGFSAALRLYRGQFSQKSGGFLANAAGLQRQLCLVFDLLALRRLT